MSTEHDPLASMKWPEPAAPRAELSQAIRKQCTENLSACHCASAGRRAMWTALLALTMAGLLLGLAEMFHPLGPGTLLGALAWSLVLVVLLVVGLGSPAARRPASLLRRALVCAVPVLFVVYLGLHASSGSGFDHFVHSEATGAMRCGLFSFGVGAVITTLMLALWRRSDPITPSLSGALIGLGGGLSASIGAGIGCSTNESWHMLLGHGPIVIGLGVFGWAIGRRWLAP
jgi:hypothetical protein